ncbi:hypothetical protein Glove_396g66 [Diversispora epigaea]|uniref:Uncharacterized protein n=1 Tax=Diversispora epigaea TaxID=1348612 RepID=A0A397H4J2_9GLOM|nr:hypothetical protein Glove_396g66 [Diversispora epigaea]
MLIKKIVQFVTDIFLLQEEMKLLESLHLELSIIPLPKLTIILIVITLSFLVPFVWGFPVIQGSIKPPGFRSIVVQTPVESSQFNIGSTQIIKWKSTLPVDTEVVIEILSSPRFELNPPEMVWKTTARVSDGQVKFVVGHWSYLNIFFAKVYTQGYPRIYGTSEHFTIYSLPIPT